MEVRALTAPRQPSAKREVSRGPRAPCAQRKVTMLCILACMASAMLFPRGKDGMDSSSNYFPHRSIIGYPRQTPRCTRDHSISELLGRPNNVLQLRGAARMSRDLC